MTIENAVLQIIKHPSSRLKINHPNGVFTLRVGEVNRTEHIILMLDDIDITSFKLYSKVYIDNKCIIGFEVLSSPSNSYDLDYFFDGIVEHMDYYKNRIKKGLN